jgi:hypothetical protein
MTTYHVELSGKLNLDKQSKAIEGEEALGTKFLGSRIWVNGKNVLTNLAEFEELEEVPEPPIGAPRLVKTLPDDASLLWAGPMIVQGSAVAQVFLTRTSAE